MTDLITWLEVFGSVSAIVLGIYFCILLILCVLIPIEKEDEENVKN